MLEVSGEAYIALRMTIEIQLNYPADGTTPQTFLAVQNKHFFLNLRVEIGWVNRSSCQALLPTADWR